MSSLAQLDARRERLRLDEQLPGGRDLGLRRAALGEVQERAGAGLLRFTRGEALAGRIDLAVLQALATVAEQLLGRRTVAQAVLREQRA